MLVLASSNALKAGTPTADSTIEAANEKTKNNKIPTIFPLVVITAVVSVT